MGMDPDDEDSNPSNRRRVVAWPRVELHDARSRVELRYRRLRDNQAGYVDDVRGSDVSPQSITSPPVRPRKPTPRTRSPLFGKYFDQRPGERNG